MPRATQNASFPADVLEELRKAKIIGIRSGVSHRFTAVWPALVGERLYVRSWNDKRGGWFRAFKEEPLGTLQVGKFDLPIKAIGVRSALTRQKVTRAYAEKYNTSGSKKWVDGFAQPEREINTLELVPL